MGDKLQEAERLAVIRTVFACDSDSAAALAAAMKDIRFANKSAVARQGDISGQCWLVVEGTAQSRIISSDGQETLLAVYGPGEIFGNYPEPAPLRADIIAVGFLHLLTIESGALMAFARRHADIGCGLSALFARQLDIMLDRMAARTTLTATGRVYAELLRMAGPSGRIAPPPVLAALALNVHTTRETTSRAIANLARRGIVRRSETALEILSPRLLADLVA
ncbi:Crp/Fnr family transcriptional regulator [Sphingobium aquiterrae]|uniref:Crp/Fnr family transcriptional regulator n=1 Tax=Sphingobium aquiterrae TaxID=2038656 RepID=UPI00301882C0